MGTFRLQGSRQDMGVFGELEAPVIVVEEGVLFEGHCRMTKTKPADVTHDFSVVPLKRGP